MRSSIKRRKYPLVHQGRQYSFLLLNLIYSTMICGVMFGFLFLPEIINMQDQSINPLVRAYAADRVLMLHSRLWPVVVVVICLFMLHSFRNFLFIVGPLKRFRDAFEKLGQGDLTARLFLRKRDYFLAEGQVFNRSMELLCDRVDDARKSVIAAQRTLNNLKAAAAAVPEPHGFDLKKTLDEMQFRLQQAGERTSFFTLTDTDADAGPDK